MKGCLERPTWYQRLSLELMQKTLPLMTQSTGEEDALRRCAEEGIFFATTNLMKQCLVRGNIMETWREEISESFGVKAYGTEPGGTLMTPAEEDYDFWCQVLFLCHSQLLHNRFCQLDVVYQDQKLLLPVHSSCMVMSLSSYS